MNCIIKIQSIVRGFLTRRKLLKIKDNISIDILNELIKNYNQTIELYSTVNKKLKKKIRMPNLPEVISENIAKYAIRRKYHILGTWNCSSDLKVLNKNIQVKGFTSSGPSSFGPDTKWDFLCFVDATKIKNKEFKYIWCICQIKILYGKILKLIKMKHIILNVYKKEDLVFHLTR